MSPSRVASPPWERGQAWMASAHPWGARVLQAQEAIPGQGTVQWALSIASSVAHGPCSSCAVVTPASVPMASRTQRKTLASQSPSSDSSVWCVSWSSWAEGRASGRCFGPSSSPSRYSFTYLLRPNNFLFLLVASQGGVSPKCLGSKAAVQSCAHQWHMAQMRVK